MKSRKHFWLAVIAGPPAVIFAFVMGLYAYMTASITPLHPDPKGLSSVAAWAPSPKWTGAVERSRQLVRASVVELNLPGLSIAVGADGEIVWAEGFGWADLQKRTPVTPQTLFRTGGASIALTSAAVGLLLEKDRLHLDDEIQTYVPTFPKKQWPVTVRELMAHVAGFRKDEGDEEPLSERCDRTADGLRRFADEPLGFEPQTKYSYSNYGWILVSAAVEAAAGEPFFTFMQTNIFAPLGMKDTIPDSGTDPIPDRATFYYPKFAADNRYGHDLAREGDYSCFAGAGAFLSTSSDLVRFAMAVNSGRLLQPATVKMLEAPQRLSSGQETGYGLGWDLGVVSLAGESTTTVGHDGEFFIGGSTAVITFPDRGLVVAVTTNTSFADTSSVALKTAEAFAATFPRRR
jgi:CubicO group peptidase (beta-lactamase class C family)